MYPCLCFGVERQSVIFLSALFMITHCYASPPDTTYRFLYSPASLSLFCPCNGWSVNITGRLVLCWKGGLVCFSLGMVIFTRGRLAYLAVSFRARHGKYIYDWHYKRFVHMHIRHARITGSPILVLIWIHRCTPALPYVYTSVQCTYMSQLKAVLQICTNAFTHADIRT